MNKYYICDNIELYNILKEDYIPVFSFEYTDPLYIFERNEELDKIVTIFKKSK